MTRVTNIPYEALEVGQTASYSKTVEERDIQLFAAMSGDHNPVHPTPSLPPPACSRSASPTACSAVR